MINPLFMVAFFGPGALCLVMIAVNLFVRPPKALIILASMIYLFGCLGVTIVFNVPMNDSLAMVKPYSFEAAALWPRYLASWTTWNHVRTVAAILAAVAFTLTLNDPFSATD